MAQNSAHSPLDSNSQSSSKFIETRSIDYIPEAERHGRLWSQFTLWFGTNLQITSIVTGALAVILGGDVFWSLIGLFEVSGQDVEKNAHIALREEGLKFQYLNHLEIYKPKGHLGDFVRQVENILSGLDLKLKIQQLNNRIIELKERLEKCECNCASFR